MLLHGIHMEREEEVEQKLNGNEVWSLREMSLSWGRLERLAQDRDAFRALVGGLCTRK
jgi:hypothetical protein